MLKILVAISALFLTTAVSEKANPPIQDIFNGPPDQVLPIPTIQPLPTLDDLTVSSVHLPEHRVLDKEQQQGLFNYGKLSVLEECFVQKSLYWCDKPKVRTKTMQAYDIVLESLLVRKKFTYQEDKKDNWRSHTGDILLDEYWFGDCDDLMSTTMDMLARKGQPLNKMWMVLVAVKPTNSLDHVVGVVQDNEGRYWVVGDTDARSSYPLEAIKYRVVAVTRLDDVINWMDPRVVGFFPESTLQAPIR